MSEKKEERSRTEMFRASDVNQVRFSRDGNTSRYKVVTGAIFVLENPSQETPPYTLETPGIYND